jgi:hypothetical protein
VPDAPVLLQEASKAAAEELFRQAVHRAGDLGST